MKLVIFRVLKKYIKTIPGVRGRQTKCFLNIKTSGQQNIFKNYLKILFENIIKRTF